MHMWMTFAIIAVAIIMFATERVALEVTSLGVIAALLILFRFFPVAGPDGANLLDPAELLSGFANPALITILALLVIGQGLQQTGALDGVMQVLSAARRSRLKARAILWACIAAAGILSAFMNNTPVVVIFIPVIAALANRYGPGAGAMLLPLSYITILGGMTTLVGSSTNLLVAGMVKADNAISIGFFDLFVPGIILAGAGAVYVWLVMPWLLSDVASRAKLKQRKSGMQFLARLDIGPDHPLAGEKNTAGMFRALDKVTVLSIERGNKVLTAPFEDIVLAPGDHVHIAGTRTAVIELLGLDREEEHAFVAEAAVAPGSRLAGQLARDDEFYKHTGCHLAGLQRQSRMKRLPMNRIRLRPGDVLLIEGSRKNLRKLRLDRDLMVLEGSVTTITAFGKSNHAFAIFAAVVAAAASGLVPIVISALAGALAMLLCGCLTVRQAGRAINGRIVMLIAASIAMALSLEKTGGAAFLAQNLIGALDGMAPGVIISAIFALTAILTNMLSNNATALLFTPIAISAAAALDLPPVAFIHAVIFAANCSFASPIGYQTNLLVMGPGNYRFFDYIKAGGPLVILIWLVFSLIAPWQYGL